MIRSLLAALCVVFLLAPQAAFAQKAAPEKTVAGKTERKPQAVLAAKGISFGTLPATDAKVVKAHKATDLTIAKTMTGKEATFVGVVVKVFQPRSNSVVLLNFARDYKTALVGAIQANDFAAFPDLNTLTDKNILVTGKVIDYRGQPQIELTRPTQIKIISKALPSP